MYIDELIPIGLNADPADDPDLSELETFRGPLSTRWANRYNPRP